MIKGVSLEKIEKELERLSPEEKLRLMERVVRQLRKTGLGKKKEVDWSKLYGLGKGLWKGEDAQDYVERLRKERI